MNNEFCYLLHFSAKYGHASHYLGMSRNLSRRLQQHRDGSSRAVLIDYARAQGITFTLARVWPGGRALERQLKNRKESPSLCSICNPKVRLSEDEIDDIKFFGNYCKQQEASNG